MKIEIDAERLAKLEAAHLLNGSHSVSENGAGCVMNWANFLAGGDGSLDSHPCVSRSVAALLIRLNDRLPDDERDVLKPYAAKVLGTAADGYTERERSWMAADCAIRELAPLWLERAGLETEAEQLRALPKVGPSNYLAARDMTAAFRKKAWALRQERRKALGGEDAADAAYAAAADAAYAAAAAAAYAADAAAAYAADAAAAADAADAAADAADAYGSKAREKTYAEVHAKVSAHPKPTRDESIKLVLGLLDRMIALGGQ